MKKFSDYTMNTLKMRTTWKIMRLKIIQDKQFEVYYAVKRLYKFQKLLQKNCSFNKKESKCAEVYRLSCAACCRWQGLCSESMALGKAKNKMRPENSYEVFQQRWRWGNSKYSMQMSISIHFITWSGMKFFHESSLSTHVCFSKICIHAYFFLPPQIMLVSWAVKDSWKKSTAWTKL